MIDYEFFMKEALKEAKLAYDLEEAPIGCVIVLENKIIARGHNMRNSKKNVLCHAEIIAINEACINLNDWRLENTIIFTTVEPCPMCAGAIVQSRIKELVFGTQNNKFGSAGSVINILEEPKFNHQTKITKDILKDECANIMKDFFKNIRNKTNN